MMEGRLRGTEMDRCSSCRGLWLDGGELAALLGTPADLPPGEAGRPTNRGCPRCGVGLSERRYRRDSEVLVDACAKCGGVFLDAGELPRVEALSQGLDDPFPPARLARLERRSRSWEEASRRAGVEKPAWKAPLVSRLGYLQRVYGLLAGTLAIAAGGALLGRAEALVTRAWFVAVAAGLACLVALWPRPRLPGAVVPLLCGLTASIGFLIGAVDVLLARSGHFPVVWAALALAAALFGTLATVVAVRGQDLEWALAAVGAAGVGLVLFLVGKGLFPAAAAPIGTSLSIGVILFASLLFAAGKSLLNHQATEAAPAVTEIYVTFGGAVLLILILILTSRRRYGYGYRRRYGLLDMLIR